MTWQEELRKLDEDFSSGNITADEYRVRRDQVLSSAVAPQQEQPGDQGGGNADATQIVAPVSPQQPQQQPQGPPPSDNPDATQVVRNTGGEAPPMYHNPEADRTQAVPHWETQQPSPPYGVPQQDPYHQPSPPYGVPQQEYQQPASPPYGVPQQDPYHQPSPPYGVPQQEYQQPAQYEQPTWHSAHEQEEAAPVWGGQEFPPIAPPSEPDWVTQGPEFDKEPEEKGRTGKIIGAVLAVLLLAGIGVGAWLLWGQGDGDNTAGPGGGDKTSEAPGPTTEPQKPAPPPEPKDALPIADLPGTPEEHPEVKTFEDMADKNYLNDKELSAYEKAGAGETKFHVQHLASGNSAPLVLTATDDGKKAKSAVKALRDIQLENGAEEAPKPPRNVFVTEYTDQKTRAAEIRAHYVSGNVIVRIEVKAKEGIKEARKDFLAVLNAQLKELPAE